MNHRRYGVGLGTLLFVAALFFAFLYRQWLIDEFNYYTYHPDAAISAIASRDQLTATGTLYFYASRPTIEERAAFTQDCGQHEASTAVLGCYTDQHIYLFDVTSQELDGIKEVTAAHEMLHAAYDRLSPSKRQEVNQLLTDEAEKLKQDPAFSKRISVYSSLPSDQYVNELHSIIGTEVKDPGSALETYYRAYFTDRAVIIALHDKYASVFTQLQDSAQALVDSLNRQVAVINADTAQYNTEAGQLQADIEAFNARAATEGGFASQAAFNQAREALTARVAALEAFRQQINQLVATYNADKQRFDSMETHLTTLNNSINSNLAPAPRV